MLNLNKNKFFFQKKIIILKIFIIFSVTSCHLNIFSKNSNHLLDGYNQKQFKKLIIPKGINIPTENHKYTIPYTAEELNKENSDIFPPK